MPFLAKLDLDTSGDARAARRLLVDRLDALLVGHDYRFDVIIHNMSETGFLAEFSSELHVGDEVRLALSQLGFVPARIVWKRGFGHGCEFLERVPLEIVEETIGTSIRFGAHRDDRMASADRRGRRRTGAWTWALLALAGLLAAIAFLAMRA